ncbi:MAG TPA: hypothetical protein VMC43_03825 [Candidatus Paceibacterota bacterium]|nr:hypothetical protein [Candidatus Paceibacterota bacterium]
MGKYLISVVIGLLIGTSAATTIAAVFKVTKLDLSGTSIVEGISQKIPSPTIEGKNLTEVSTSSVGASTSSVPEKIAPPLENRSAAPKVAPRVREREDDGGDD